MTKFNQEQLLDEHLCIADLFDDWRCVAEGWTAMESKVCLNSHASYYLITRAQADGTVIHELELTELIDTD